jgi:L-threonylcarbamoyladenylate synthase
MNVAVESATINRNAASFTLGHPVTQRLKPNDVSKAAALLRDGKLVAFPTETVYGLGADARDGKAVAGIFKAKSRPSFNPLIVHLPSLSEAEKIAHFDDDARALAQAFWPGPMSLVLPLRANAGISDLVSAGLLTIAIRVPAHPLAVELLTQAACPVAAPSANPSGQISPTTADHVLEGLAGKIDAVLDGGACNVGVESSIISTNPVTLLRAGGISLEDITETLGHIVAVREESGTLNAPGQMASHYAPNAPIRINATHAEPDEIMIGFADTKGDLNLSDTGDMTQAAANLFAMLRQADSLAKGKRIAVARVPMTGLGRAINDRLIRAAAPRN